MYFSEESDTDLGARAEVKRLDHREIVTASAGTRMMAGVSNPTSGQSATRATSFAFFSDGSSLKSAPPLILQAWRSLATSAGKTFEWEGLVQEVKEDSFFARLRNVKGAPAEYEEYAEFSIDEVPLGDRDLLLKGAIFRWVVGLESRSGTRQRYSRIVFRRLPAWTQRSLERSKAELSALVADIVWAEDDTAGG
jgi:hypothetical protein